MLPAHRPGQKAISDYRAFLEAVPAAPNRADIEAKVAALTPPTAPVASAPELPCAGAAGTAAPAASVYRTAASAGGGTAARRDPAARRRAVRPASPAAVLSQPAPAAPAAEPDSASGHNGHLWLWIAIGAAVVGGAAGAYIALRAPATTPPPTDLGNYKF